MQSKGFLVVKGKRVAETEKERERERERDINFAIEETMKCTF
jgi:hypothetical protein